MGVVQSSPSMFLQSKLEGKGAVGAGRSIRVASDKSRGVNPRLLIWQVWQFGA
jgi:hypothetical protein